MAIVCALPFFQSCTDSDDFDYSLYYPSAIVTVKPIDESSFFLQLDDQTALWPVDEKSLIFDGKEVRALVNYTEVSMPEGIDTDKYAKAVKINWIDSVLTKAAVPTEGEEIDEEKYGSDPVDLLNSWMTVVEDGYLTLHFRTYWGNSNIKHSVNLITGTNPDDPYEVVFRHNSFDDRPEMAGDGIVAFSLKNLQDTEGETVKLTLKWNSFNGTQSAKFNYCTRED